MLLHRNNLTCLQAFSALKHSRVTTPDSCRTPKWILYGTSAQTSAERKIRPHWLTRIARACILRGLPQ